MRFAYELPPWKAPVNTPIVSAVSGLGAGGSAAVQTSDSSGFGDVDVVIGSGYGAGYVELDFPTAPPTLFVSGDDGFGVVTAQVQPDPTKVRIEFSAPSFAVVGQFKHYKLHYEWYDPSGGGGGGSTFPTQNMYGAFLVASVGGVANGDYNGTFASFNFALDWQPAIDAVKARGGNCISFIGTVNEIAPNGPLSLSTYLGYLSTILNYCLLHSIYVQIIIAGSPYQWDPAVTDAQAQTIMSAVANLAKTFSNVVCLTCVDEGFFGPGGVPINTSGPFVARMLSFYTPTKAAAGSGLLVAATSNPCGNVAGSLVWDAHGQQLTNLNSLIAAGVLDFFDFHPFYTGALLTDSDVLRVGFPNKKIIMASAGDQTTDGNFVNVCNTLGNFVGANNFWMFNVFSDVDISGSGQATGLLNSDFTDRAARVAAFEAIQKPYVPRKTIGPIESALLNGSANGGMSAPFDSTGANFGVVWIAQSNATTPLVAPTDNKGNTWHALTSRIVGGFTGTLYYAMNAITGAGHTVTVTGANILDCSIAAFFSNVDIVSPFELETGTELGVIGNSIQLPNIDPPTADYSLIIAGLMYNDSTAVAINQGFTIARQAPVIGGQSYAGALAYKVQGISNTENPTFNWTNASDALIEGAAFKAMPS